MPSAFDTNSSKAAISSSLGEIRVLGGIVLKPFLHLRGGKFHPRATLASQDGILKVAAIDARIGILGKANIGEVGIAVVVLVEEPPSLAGGKLGVLLLECVDVIQFRTVKKGLQEFDLGPVANTIEKLSFASSEGLGDALQRLGTDAWSWSFSRSK
ncbi:MAG: hypothetical protein H0T51_22210 [Pirellulales bacterium]|nr:hypothetical protein [Pirellulales bacterium]